jgi:hypothetical protein
MARAHSSTSSWQRQREEPPRAHALFEQYLSLGPARSLPALARASGRSYGYLKRLSCEWHWQERAASWELHLQAGAASATDAAQEARARHIRDAQTLQQLARAQLARWIAKHPDGSVRLRRRLSGHQVARAWQLGYRMEHELLPPPPPGRPPDPGKKLQEARFQEARDQRNGPPEKLDLPRELAAFVRLLRKLHLSRGQVAQHHAQLLRWLWLPEEEGLSLSALSMANSKGSITNHESKQRKTNSSRRA